MQSRGGLYLPRTNCEHEDGLESWQVQVKAPEYLLIHSPPAFIFTCARIHVLSAGVADSLFLAPITFQEIGNTSLIELSEMRNEAKK